MGQVLSDQYYFPLLKFGYPIAYKPGSTAFYDGHQFQFWMVVPDFKKMGVTMPFDRKGTVPLMAPIQ
tara:strand:+ start:18882 stop:19082 length:201 start_codon:yes stop_codon:yes gene_type:complete